MSRNRKRTLKSLERHGPLNRYVNKPKNAPRTRQERAATKNSQERLIRLVVALPEDQAVQLLASARLYYRTPDAPIFGKYANQVVLYAIEQLYTGLEHTYAASSFWKGIKAKASADIRT